MGIDGAACKPNRSASDEFEFEALPPNWLALRFCGAEYDLKASFRLVNSEVTSLSLLRASISYFQKGFWKRRTRSAPKRVCLLPCGNSFEVGVHSAVQLLAHTSRTRGWKSLGRIAFQLCLVIRKVGLVVEGKVRYLDLPAGCAGFGSPSTHGQARLFIFLGASSALYGAGCGRRMLP